jgi:hypothetical protein
MLEGEIFDFVRKWWKKKEDREMCLAEECAKEAAYLESLDKPSRQSLIENRRVLIKFNADCENKHLKKLFLLEKLSQPIFDCPVCMAPWHGTYLYWLIPWQRIGLPAHDWVAWLVVIIGALGLNSIIIRTFKDE